ncbi:Hypothetical predicted protein [Lynx pardinus]|uniref:Uncharacterized protein n=1 Tax=Lynx pardinus TaxID=191816 RepID=A0A485NI62_LYNPA|nr:Hypothetical predicted protein [Lynx pardinus]
MDAPRESRVASMTRRRPRQGRVCDTWDRDATCEKHSTENTRCLLFEDEALPPSDTRTGTNRSRGKREPPWSRMETHGPDGGQAEDEAASSHR